MGARHDPSIALQLIYLMMFKFLGWTVMRARAETVKEIEILVLRHQLAMLRGPNRQPMLDWADRALIAALTRLLPVHRRLGLLVTPVDDPALAQTARRQPLGHQAHPTRRPAISGGLRALIVPWPPRTRPGGIAGSTASWPALATGSTPPPSGRSGDRPVDHSRCRRDRRNIPKPGADAVFAVSRAGE